MTSDLRVSEPDPALSLPSSSAPAGYLPSGRPCSTKTRQAQPSLEELSPAGEMGQEYVQGHGSLGQPGDRGSSWRTCCRS